MRRRLQGALGLVVLLALAVGLPWALAATIGNPLNQWSSIRSGDMSDRDVIAIMAAVAYLAWASFALALLVELAASLAAAVTRHPRRVIRLPLLGMQHDLARTLIAAVLLLAPAVISGAGPATSALASSPPSVSVSAPVSRSARTDVAPRYRLNHQPTSPAATTHTAPAAGDLAEDLAGAGTYVIPSQGGMRSYWALAEHYLGDGQRWPEIWRLNEGHHQADGSVMDSPNLLRRGWTVTVPAPATGSPAAAAVRNDTTAAGHGEHAVTVHEGDTLSGLAEAAGVADWTTVWPANAGRAEPGNEQLTDPDLIKPGWTVLMPGGASSPPAGTSVPTHPTTHPTTHRPAHRPPGRTTPPATTPRSGPPQQRPTNTPTTAPTTAAPQPGTKSTTPTTSSGSTAAGLPAHSARNDSSEVVTVAQWTASLSAGAGLLAGGVFLALRGYRRRQLRHRGARRAIPGPAPHHVPLEKVLVTDGSVGLRDVDFIDRALRALSLSATTTDARLPAVLAARLTAEHLDLVLADSQPEAPPPPWVAVSPTSWVIEKSAQLPVVGTSDHDPAGQLPAPYPTLVSVGFTAAGEEWLVDLEQCGALIVDGDRDRCLDLTRFIAAELAHNIWCDHLTVTVAGQFGAELVELNPSRLIAVDDISTAAAVAANDVRAHRDVADGEHVDVLHGRLHGVSGDTWMPQVLLLAPATSQPADSAANVAADVAAIESLLDTVGERSSRSAVAVVLLPGPEPLISSTGLRLHVDASGTLTIPALGVTATAQRLPADQALELGTYLAAVHDSAADVPMPPAAGEAGTAAGYTDLAGAVLPEHTVPRPDQRATAQTDTAQTDAAQAPAVPAASPAGPPDLSTDPGTVTDPISMASLLPNSTSSYLVTGARTPAEIDALAPVVKPEVSAALLAADPHLDEDLAAWHNTDISTATANDRPRIRLLGGVEVIAAGTRPEPKTAIATEAVAYLTLHSAGVTGDRFAADFWPRNTYTIKDSNPKNLLSIVRSWLGTDPLSGSPCLPYAKSAGRPSGTALYKLSGPLVDWDLFCRLRSRGEAGGAGGLADYVAALDLVDGVPLTGLRPGGGAWLADDSVADANVMAAAIVDVASVVVTRALDEADLALARRMAEKAVAIESGSDRPLLDLAAVCEAEGRTAELGATVRRIVTHHGAVVEEDVPKDTYDVLLRRGWVGLTQAS